MLLKIMMVAYVAISVLACGNIPSGELKDGKAVAVPEVNEVEVITLERTDFAHQLLTNGKLKALRRASLSFGADGVVSALNVSNGGRITAGSIIAKLDRPDLKLSLEAAQIALEKAELDFYDVLAGQGYVARDTAGVPDNVLAMAKMRSGYTSAKNSLARARLDYEGAVLKAPYDGKIADLRLKKYDRTAADPFCTVIDDKQLDVDFSVMESEYAFLEKGLQVRVIPFADPSKSVIGKVSEINPTVDKNGQIAVRAVVRNDGALIDGMNVKVIVERMMPGQLVVPRSAVVVRDNLDVMFTYTDDGVAHWTYVNIICSNGDSHVVTANADRGARLNEGDKVIVKGNLNLADGSKVQLNDIY
ncbi:MAG: efflux RND transporter periplasmic adaptor subunit [Bacteroidales bacterium]|nr:efflux RND transporter periplasmic adaptor subunit [Bacteroidales bacterium]